MKEKIEEIKTDKNYVLFKGELLYTVQKALENNGVFLTIAQLMDNKTKDMKFRMNSNEDSRDKNSVDWTYTSFVSMTPIFCTKKGDIKIGDINDAKVMTYIRNISPDLIKDRKPDSHYILHGLTLPEDFRLNSISGEKFSQKHVKQYANKDLTPKEAKYNPFWKLFSNNNQSRLDEFIEQNYKLGIKQGASQKIMEVRMPDFTHYLPTENSMGLITLDKHGFLCTHFGTPFSIMPVDQPQYVVMSGTGLPMLTDENCTIAKKQTIDKI